MNDVITEQKIDHYLNLTKKALDKLRIVSPERSFFKKMTDDFLGMATSYYRDAEYFRKKGDFVIAFAAINYAHGWIDCGARIGLWDVQEDDQLFTLYE